MGVLNTTMPPILETYQEANVVGESMRIYFSPSPFNNLSMDDTWGIHVVVRRQTDNRTAFRFYTNPESQSEQTQYLNSIIAGDVLFVTNKPTGSSFNGIVCNYSKTKDMYYFDIKEKYIEQNVNHYYQIQLRYDTSFDKKDFKWTEYPGSNESTQKNLPLVYNYLTTKTDNFSEWSTVSIIKCINQPVVELNQFLADEEPFYQWGLLRLTGHLRYYDRNGSMINDTNVQDSLQWYQIKIFDMIRGNEVYSKEVYTLEQENRNSINCILNFQNFVNPLTTKRYRLEFSYTTTSNYVNNFSRIFTIGRYTIDPKFETTSISISSDKEEGKIHLAIKNNYELYGTLYVRRASAINDFEDWTDLYIKEIADPLDIDLVDETIQSLTYYKYSLQYENKKGVMSQTLVAKNLQDDLFSCNYEDNFIYRDGIQLPLRGEFTISNYKPVVNRAKIDTLGKRYPKFAENANLNYKQFAINGDITSWHDVFRSFLSEKVFFKDKAFDKYQEYKKEYNVKDIHRNDYSGYWDYRRDQEDILRKENGMWIPSPESMTLDDTVFMSPYQDVYWEREFREKAIQWLNDGEPKLMKTQPEGAIVVMLTDVSLTPKQQLGRLLYSFSATAYEVEDATSLEILDALGIIHVRDTNKALGNDKLIPGYIRTEDLLVNGEYVSLRETLLAKVRESFQGVQGDYEIEDESKFVFHNVKLFVTDVNIPEGETAAKYYEFQIRDSYNDDNYKTIKVPLTFHEPSPDNNTLNSFYQIPDTIDVYDIKWKKAKGGTMKLNNSNHIEFIMEYQKTANSEVLFDSVMMDRTTIGQIFLEKVYQEDISNYIKNKYKTYQKNDNNTEQIKEVGNWRAVQVDGPPMTIIQCKQEGIEESVEYIIGYDGVLNLRVDKEVYIYEKESGSLQRDINQDTYNLENLYVLGRRFTIVNNTIQSLKPWEVRQQDVRYLSTAGYWVAKIYKTQTEYVEYKFNVSNNNIGTSGLLEIPVTDLTLNYMVDVFIKERKG